MADSYNHVISSVVQEYCAVNRVSQASVAEVLGLQQGRVSDRFRGRANWTLRDVTRLHGAYGLEFPLPALVGAR